MNKIKKTISYDMPTLRRPCDFDEREKYIQYIYIILLTSYIQTQKLLNTLHIVTKKNQKVIIKIILILNQSF